MPIYEYRCQKCGHRIELIQKFSDKPLTKCSKCKGKLTKVISPPALQFKGSGFYITDYTDKGKPPKSESEPKEKSKEKSKEKGKEKAKTESSEKTSGDKKEPSKKD